MSALLSLVLLASPSHAADVLLSVDGVTVVGDALSLAPVEGPPVSGLRAVTIQGDPDGDGLCDAGDADDERVGGGKGKGGTTIDTDSDGLCDRLASDGGFLHGQTVYVEARAAGGGGFLDGQTIYVEARVSGSGGKGVVGLEGTTDACQLAVWSAGALVLRAEVACAEAAVVVDESGIGVGPDSAHAALVPSKAAGGDVTVLSWSWAGDGVDPSGAADWVE